ncbi:MAG: bifunctional methylenetetrahydrofolate dehydrogenase/methenyltetrahydrofolate cyclohydrolase [Bdellovibrionales bacterium RBG_16_40_8]|nr:MAG: bifunctional methylenetetrahydrofolate dehydrogenase/methenyltetrahydrofolate cyclohydrolase [Bdellovibrionales bacterium RBG_16_40_8]
MLLLNGKKVSEHKREELKKRAKVFKKTYEREPGLAVVIVGDDPASHVYVRNKVKACEEIGIRSLHHHLMADTKEEKVIELITNLNSNKDTDAILLQLPLPSHLHAETILSHINPKKDADGLTIENMGLLFAGRPRVVPCTPKGVMEILKFYEISVSGKNCVVIGRSQIVGRPMAQLLLLNDATVTTAHSKTKNLSTLTNQADIVVVAAGKPNFLGADDFNKNAVVIDVGIHRLASGLCGDVRFSELKSKVKAATPVPGGVGPMTITMLLENTLILAEASAAQG